MANAIPLLEGTDASGGYLVPDAWGRTLQNQLLRMGAVGAVRFDRVAGKRTQYPIYAGRPTAAFVGEGAIKPATGAEFTVMTVNVKKIATIVMYTEELIEDAREDPSVLVNADVNAAFADLIDAHLLGYQAGTQIATSFDQALRASTQTTELANTGGARYKDAVSAAMGLIEENGYTATDVIAPTDLRQHLRDAPKAVETTDRVYDQSDPFWGLTPHFSSNLPKFASVAAAGKVKGIVLDRTETVGAMRKDMVIKQSSQATVDVAGTLHHLWQQNKVASLWEMRLGFAVHDINKSVALILDAA